MKILLSNCNFTSSSGPNGFGNKLAVELQKLNHQIVQDKPDIQLAFIESPKIAPMVLRLDGIWFRTNIDYVALNEPIKRSYDEADAVIFQSNFNRALSTKFFGAKKNNFVISNGTDLEAIEKIPPFNHKDLDKFENIWTTASSWRRNKRLKENINYFITHAPMKDCMIVAGENPDYSIQHPRIFFIGQKSWSELISLYKRSKYFVFLSYLDHCPNVVVDARACGCELIISSSGGTKEICGSKATIVIEDDWNFSPCDFEPPYLDFSRKLTINKKIDNSQIDIKNVAKKYISVLESVLKGIP